MKKLLLLLATLAVSQMSNAQAPQAIPYQAAARNSSGAVLASTAVSVRFTIRDSIATGTIQYRETHSVTTSAQGLFSVNVGQGTPVTGTFSGINWGTNAKYMQVELDPTGGSTYTDMGTQQMLSVPYALHAKYAENSFTHRIGEYYEGGVIFALWKDIIGKEHGLIVGLKDLSTSIQWGCYGTTVGGTTTFRGKNATSLIYASCGISTASGMCDTATSNGYNDWYLPSKDELDKLYGESFLVNTTLYSLSAIGAVVLSTGQYWSSSENGQYTAWNQSFSSGSQNGLNKNLSHYVRAIRSF
jgi:hypothetical protein